MDDVLISNCEPPNVPGRWARRDRSKIEATPEGKTSVSHHKSRVTSAPFSPQIRPEDSRLARSRDPAPLCRAHPRATAGVTAGLHRRERPVSPWQRWPRLAGVPAARRIDAVPLLEQARRGRDAIVSPPSPHSHVVLTGAPVE